MEGVKEREALIHARGAWRSERDVRRHLRKRGVLPHQIDACVLALRYGEYALFLDTGTGKTRTMLEYLRLIRMGNTAESHWPALILCPLTIISDAWLGDCRKFTPELCVISGAGKPEHRRRAIERASLGQCDALVINHEAAIRHRLELLEIRWGVLILDESTRIKAPKAKRTKLALTLARKTPRRFCLSGCPAPHGMLDLWSQMEIVHPGLLPASYWAMRNHYFYKVTDFKWVPKPGAKTEILEKLKPRAVFVKKNECLELPPQTFVTETIDLAPAERAAYQIFVRDCLLRFQDGTMAVAESQLTEVMRCRQMCAGLIKTEDGEWKEIGDSKLRAIQQKVEDIGPKPIIIVGYFRRECERLHSAMIEMGRTSALLYGGMTSVQRDEAREGFLDGRYQTLVVNAATAGHGLNLQGACADMIFSTLDYNYDNHYQVLQRIHRHGTTNPCTYYFMLARDTVDRDVYRAVQERHRLSESIIEALRRSVVYG